MSRKLTHSGPRGLRTWVLVAALGTAVLAAAGGATAGRATADGASAERAADKPAEPKSMILGKTSETPGSGCPTPSRCQVVARVTGIQMQADGRKLPFRVPSSGQIVAWWLKLPELRSTQVTSFSEYFGGQPAARISVLRRGEKGRFRLIRESADQPLAPYLREARRRRFRLAEPLQVREGDYIGVTTVTWLPAFAVDLDSEGDVWRASRPRNRCETPSSEDPDQFAAYYRRNFAHTPETKVKRYMCLYRTARLLYWARFVPDPQQDEQQTDSGTAAPEPAQ